MKKTFNWKSENLISMWKKGFSSRKYPNPTGIQEISIMRFKSINRKYLMSSTKCCGTGTCVAI